MAQANKRTDKLVMKDFMMIEIWFENDWLTFKIN